MLSDALALSWWFYKDITPEIGKSHGIENNIFNPFNESGNGITYAILSLVGTPNIRGTPLILGVHP